MVSIKIILSLIHCHFSHRTDLYTSRKWLTLQFQSGELKDPHKIVYYLDNYLSNLYNYRFRETVDSIIPLIEALSKDTEPVVKQHLVEQLRHLAKVEENYFN